MTKRIITPYKFLLLIVLPLQLAAQTVPVTQHLEGFAFGDLDAPIGTEWESPEKLSLNKELPHAYHFSFDQVASARKVLPEHSSNWKSLNGTWKFHWVKTPDERPKDFHQPLFDDSSWDEVPVPMNWNILGVQEDGSLKYGVPIYVNQPVIFQHQVKVDDWRGGVMRTPPTHWTTYSHRNEVGSYRRSFTIPRKWKGKEVYINFDGVDSFFYLWVNGKYVGFSKNSRNLASFNITKYLHATGDNTVAVEVYRNSDASFLEAQDMFRLPGIFRTVSLSAKPSVQIRNLVAIPDLDAAYQDGSLKITSEILNTGDQPAAGYKVRYTLYKNELYSDDNERIGDRQLVTAVENVASGGTRVESAVLHVDNPLKWSAERPYRYTLVAELLTRKNTVAEVVSTHIGFRKVEVKDTPAAEDEFGLAGRYFYVNGKTVKLKGVNRHETNPATGHVVSREQMESEIKLLKQANINHVRNSHYPDDPYWYYLCDKYGIYLEDEANVESHQYYYGEASLSHPAAWKNAHVARNLEMVHATINHPSIVIWSLGNEAGPGQNFVAAYTAIKKVDDSRPVQYERNNSIVDIGSNQYPSINWVREAVKGKYKLKYPFHISEYAHSMGNATGNLIDYWEAIESSNFFMGGAIWDWVDQSMYAYDKDTRERYMAYGGDFGDAPNDGTFVMNGLLFSDLTPKPAYYEVRKVYQNVAVKVLDTLAGKIEIFNKNYFTSLSDYQIRWSLWCDGQEIEQGDIDMNTDVGPREKVGVDLPYDWAKLQLTSEYFVKIQFLCKEEKPWGQKGFVQMEEQFLLKGPSSLPFISTVATGSDLSVLRNETLHSVNGDRFTVQFDDRTGTIHRFVYDGDTLIRPGDGPQLDALRAPLDNDNWAYQQWFEKGLYHLQHQTLSVDGYLRNDGAYVLAYMVESQAPYGATIRGGSSGTYTLEEHVDNPFSADDFKFVSHYIWTIYKDGSIELASNITSNNSSLVLPHIGFSMQIPAHYRQYDYYGRGPFNNYVDRKTSQFIQRYSSTVEEQYFPWPKPQSTGNREELRWCSLTDDDGKGVLFVSSDHFAASALPWRELEMTLAPHTYQLPSSTGTHLYLLADVTGLGGNSCGQGPPLETDRVKAEPKHFGFIIRPVRSHNQDSLVKVLPAGEMPISVDRDRNGLVSIASRKSEAPLYYQIDQEVAQPYTKSFSLREGGVVTAWYQANEKLKVRTQFPKMASIPLEVISVSSQEIGEGSATHLLDGDPSTIWHTMYSVTVAQYPHWVDFDAGMVKEIKGFTYLPRQDGTNGHIKGYRVQLSQDGKNWGQPIVEGEFERGNKLKTVWFPKVHKARYVRFSALSSQNGEDFASGAELVLLED